MRAAGFGEDDVDQVLWRNPVAFYGQSGRLELDGPEGAEASGVRAEFEGSSIRRGER